MQVKNVLIYQANPLTALTVNSIKKNMPDWTYKVVKSGTSKIGTALKNVDDISLVVRSGTVLNIKKDDLPTKEKLEKYHIALSREHVFTDHTRLCGAYQVKLGEHPNPNLIDLSVFIINPFLWTDIPEKDSGVFLEKKKLYMPRYMNHKEDILVKENLSARDCNIYGMLSKKSCILNYVNCILNEKITMSEKFSYAFDEVNKYTDGLDSKYKNIINKFSNMTDGRYDKFKGRLAEVA